MASPAPAPGSDCGSDAECLGKRYARSDKSRVTTVVAAATLTADAGAAETGTAWVAARRADGLVVVTRSGEGLGEGAVLLALRPPDADVLVAGGLFRRVG